MKKIYLKLSILISIGMISLFYSCNLLSDKETKLESVKLKESIQTNDLFAIKVEKTEKVGSDTTGTGEYIDETNIPAKADGYIFNPDKSGCMNADGHMLNDVLTYRNDMIKVDVIGTTYCYLYFDYLDNAENFCVTQGITNLSDCLLVMDNYSLDREEAIDYINAKTYDTTKTSPSYNFKMVTTTNVDNSDDKIAGRSSWMISSNYNFNQATGMFELSGAIAKKMETSDIGKYTCGGSTGCFELYKINEFVEDGVYQKLVNFDLSISETTASFDSETGIYVTEDGDGPTYFYRGNITNNYVQFGGYYWKVVRINGDGSIRMIYAGTSTTESGEDDIIGKSGYNSKKYLPLYVGYKYKDTDLEISESSEFARIISEDYEYYFADSYIDNGNGTFKLSGNMKKSTWKELYESGEWKTYHYTVLYATSDSSNPVVYNIKNKSTSWSILRATAIMYTPKNYESTLINETDSTIKTYIDTWYENNLLNAKDTNGNNITDYIYQDAKYCNDRSIYSGGNGIQVAPYTYYSFYNRSNKSLFSLNCSQLQDIFSVANGNLDYPIALLSADEAAFAGIRKNSLNEDNYLLSGIHWWTMTPNHVESAYISSRIVIVHQNGSLSNIFELNATNVGVRPVINLKSDVQVVSGNGTATNPYQITID